MMFWEQVSTGEHPRDLGRSVVEEVRGEAADVLLVRPVKGLPGCALASIAVAKTVPVLVSVVAIGSTSDRPYPTLINPQRPRTELLHVGGDG